MKKLLLFTLLLFTLLHSDTIIKSLENNETRAMNSIIGIYKPIKRECGSLKGFYCEKGITQFEFTIGKKIASDKENALEFIVWVSKYIKDTRPIDTQNLTSNGAYIVPIIEPTIKLNKIIILEELKKENYISKIQFSSYNKGVFTFGYKDNPVVIHFERITKKQDKYTRHYPIQN